MKRKLLIVGWLICLSGITGCSGCSKDTPGVKMPVPHSAKSVATEPTTPPQIKNTAPPQPGVTMYDNAAAAVTAIIAQQHPDAIGFGEFHQKNSTAQTVSALRRFTDDILPVLSARSSDIVVETWVPKGCGETEQRVVKEVEAVSERPAQTEDETVRLLRLAKESGMLAHILDVSCESYESLFDSDGQMNYLRMLELVSDSILHRMTQLENYRQRNPVEGKPMVVFYGGAIHNDLYADAEWQTVTCGPQVKKMYPRYLAIDVLVPEFIQDNNLIKDETWYPVFEANASSSQVALIKMADDSYKLILKQNRTASATDPR